MKRWNQYWAATAERAHECYRLLAAFEIGAYSHRLLGEPSAAAKARVRTYRAFLLLLIPDARRCGQ